MSTPSKQKRRRRFPRRWPVRKLHFARQRRECKFSRQRCLRRPNPSLVSADVNAVPPAGIEGLDLMANGAELAGGSLGIGPLAIGNVKYKTESGLFQRMATSPKRSASIFAMPSLSRVRSPEAGAAILIAASSGRALAAAARRAGYRPLVADFFDDSDTRGFCAANRLIEGGLDTGFEGESLIGALEELAKEATPCGFVYGAGFEDRAGLLELVAQRWTLFGNPPAVVRSVKDPVRLAELCAALNIPHPKISARMPRDGRHWLVKSAGGSGGSHVAPAGALRAEGEKIYFQRIAAGEPVSILFLGDGAKARVVGLSRQWAAPAPGNPFVSAAAFARPVYRPGWKPGCGERRKP